MMKKRMLILEDGTIFEGIAFGSEECFNRRNGIYDRHDRLSGDDFKSFKLWTNSS